MAHMAMGYPSIWLRTAALLLLATLAWTAEPAAEVSFGGLPGSGVEGTVQLIEVDKDAGTGVLLARFVPPEGFYLYSKDLPMAGVEGMGRPTLLEIAADQPLRPTGELSTESQVSDKQVADWTFPLYDAGPVELRLPVRLPAGDGSRQDITLLLSYMTCDDSTCLRPVEREEAVLAVPTVADGVAIPSARPETTDTPPPADTPDTEPAAAEDGQALAAIRQRLETITPRADLKTGDWYYPQNVDEVLAIMAGAEQAGLPYFLEFTGPSCVNCQIMKRTVFETDEALAGFADLVLVSVNTDPPHADLGDFQRDLFGTFTRPFYVRSQPGGTGQAWWTFFSPNNRETLQRFSDYLDGGPGDAEATTDAVSDSVGQAGGWLGFLLLAVAGGLFTLVMPCTYPMIPLTVNFFTKQGESGRSTVPLALTYSLGIVAFFMVVGIVFAGVIGTNPTYLAGHWITNLLIGLMFIILGGSLLGLFFLRLPASVTNLGAGGRGGYGGALMMGLAFAIISFTCTAPFAGLVLGAAMITGNWSAAVIGMAVYGAVIAVPFFFLALSPSLLKTLPGAGAWMNEFKVVGGLIEIAAALKFLYIADLARGWGIFDRTVVLALWATIALVIAGYIAGKLRLPSDAPLSTIGPWRLLMVILFAALALFFLAGLTGAHLGAVEGLFP